MLSAHFLRKTHSIMTNCKFVIGNEVKHLGCAHVDVHEILHVRWMTIHQEFFANQFCFTIILYNRSFSWKTCSNV